MIAGAALNGFGRISRPGNPPGNAMDGISARRLLRIDGATGQSAGITGQNHWPESLAGIKCQSAESAPGIAGDENWQAANLPGAILSSARSAPKSPCDMVRNQFPLPDRFSIITLRGRKSACGVRIWE